MFICLARNSLKKESLVKHMRTSLFLLISLLLGSCINSPGINLPAPLPEPAPNPMTKSDQPLSARISKEFHRTQPLAALSIAGWKDEKDAHRKKMNLPEGVFDLNFEAMPLNEFIH